MFKIEQEGIDCVHLRAARTEKPSRHRRRAGDDPSLLIFVLSQFSQSKPPFRFGSIEFPDPGIGRLFGARNTFRRPSAVPVRCFHFHQPPPRCIHYKALLKSVGLCLLKTCIKFPHSEGPRGSHPHADQRRGFAFRSMLDPLAWPGKFIRNPATASAVNVRGCAAVSTLRNA
jgi:hypothetical protein